jgi:hypothetical protein
MYIETASARYTESGFCFAQWLKHHWAGDEPLDDIFCQYRDDSSGYFETLSRISDEMFYVLFGNRDFLFRFNSFLSQTRKCFQHLRTAIPLWVQKAVFFRDHGKCIFCGKDLTGIIAQVDIKGLHYDHIVPLKQGGMNDVSNIQLTCSSCNLKKHTTSTTSKIYRRWYS